MEVKSVNSIEMEEIDDKRKINLTCIQQTTLQPISKCEFIKVEGNHSDYAIMESQIKKEEINNLDLNIKVEMDEYTEQGEYESHANLQPVFKCEFIKLEENQSDYADIESEIKKEEEINNLDLNIKVEKMDDYIAQGEYKSNNKTSNNIRRSRTNCCVVRCNNKYGNTPSTVSFYSFPRDNDVSRSRREKWIHAVKRMNEDGSPWIPTKFSRICSAHFMGNKKSEHPHHPAYVPSIFPTHKVASTSKNDSRFQRLKNRKERVIHEGNTEEIIKKSSEVKSARKEIGCQTIEYINKCTEESLDKTFLCCFSIRENSFKVDSATQTIVINKQHSDQGCLNLSKWNKNLVNLPLDITH